MAKIVNTDNFGGDYPDESFVLPWSLPERDCEIIVEILNKNLSGAYEPRFFKVVDNEYKLQPGFEP